MKAKYILIVVVLLLPIVVNANTMSLQPNVSNTPSQSLNTQVEGIGSVQMNDVDYSQSTGICVTPKSHKRNVSLSFMKGSSLVALPMQSTAMPSVNFSARFTGHAWKGQVTAIGADAPTPVATPVKHRLIGGGDSAGEIIPLGDMPWWLLLLLGVCYGVAKRLRRRLA